MNEPFIQQLDIPGGLPQYVDQKKHSTVNGQHEQQIFNDEVLPEIRQSHEAWVHDSQFDQCVDPQVAVYLKNYDYVQDRVCDRWKMLEYNNNGHFTEHIDKQENTETHYQVATQILLPPKELCNYSGGILKIRKATNEIVNVSPCSKKWTHIILPIGVPHEVTEVQGTRISYVRLVCVKKDTGRAYPIQSDRQGIRTLAVILF